MTELKPKLLIIAGPNGSGKTSVTNKILQHDWVEGCVYINPDNIARDIFGDWNSPEAVLKAAKLATQMREDSLIKNESLLFETVLSAHDKLNFIERAKIADRTYIYDNSANYEDPKLLFRVNDGKLEKTYSKVNNWAGDILKTINAKEEK